ncbi:DNA sulfur modification protein DndE [Acetobacterium sp.]|uniref:DNA sulfur modification protein DndE n=1 Tax=Acetobacterium sp. TaxID=1872094 RepID=UPI002F3E4AB1
MKTRLKTSKQGETILRNIKNKYGLTPNILCRYAIGLSLKSERPLDYKLDSNGFEFQRSTLTGDEDLLIKELIKNDIGNYITDDEYMKKYLKAHIERGLLELESSVKLCGGFENFIEELIRTGGTI